MSQVNLVNDHMCFACGRLNEQGLHLEFAFNAQEKTIACTWTPEKSHQGYAEITHGGLLSLILDEVMGNILFLSETPAVSAELNVKFHKPAPVNEPIFFKAWQTASRGKIFQMASEACNADGEVLTSAKGVYVHLVKAL